MRYIQFSKEFTPAGVYEKYKALPETIIVKEGTDDEFIFVDERDTDSFWIAGTSREDFEIRGYDTSKLSNGNMEYIAQRMRDNYIENYYWFDVDHYADAFQLPRKEKNE